MEAIDSNKTKQIISLSTVLIMFVGALGVFAAAYYSEARAPSPGSFAYAFVAGLTTLSVALVGFGIFSFALDTKNWRDYFSDRIKEIVIDSNYLKMLDAETLKGLQINVLKAQFNNPRIDKEDGFLSYFHQNLHRYISEPYREDVSTEVLMRDSIARPDCYEVTDKVIYVCRSSSNKIQTTINWHPDPDEFEEISSMTISVQYPETHTQKGQAAVVKQSNDNAELQKGFTVSLEDYESIDNLVVIIDSTYLVKKGKFQYWQMAHPTRNFDITITYPPGSRIQFKTLVLEDVVSQITQQEGYLRFKYDSWLLPQSGISWLITPATCVSNGTCFDGAPGDAQPGIAARP